MKTIYSIAFCFLLSGVSHAQNLNVQFAAQLSYTPQTLANICGYVDSLGNEYALCGASQGMTIVDVTTPSNPVQVAQIPNVNDLWKEIKIYKGFAYVTTEGQGGALQIVDLRGLPSVTNIPYQTYTGDGAINSQLSRVHSLHIDTTKGFCYLFGSNIGSGGAIVLDLNIDPYNPIYVGEYQQNGYVHDGYVDNDTLYAAHIYAGIFAVVDMTVKSAPVVLATQTTPTAFTHNVWLSDDRKFLFTTDENSNSFLAAYDISNLSNIIETDRFQTTPGSGSVVHNTHILKNWAVTAWYKDGISIVDVTRPNNLVEVGRYDTYTGTGSGFDGAWGVYPFLPSGTVVVSNINEGLFVLTPDYVRACYLEGTVTDSLCGLPLSGVTVTISSVNASTTTNSSGDFATGTSTPGTYTITFSKPGYTTVTLNNVAFVAGQVNTYSIGMTSPNEVALSGTITDSVTTQPIQNAQIVYSSSNNTYNFSTDALGTYSGCNGIADTYILTVADWGYETNCQQVTVSQANNNAQIKLLPGYEDDFTFDLGWTVAGNALIGAWERGAPVGTQYNVQGDANPGVDASGDCTDQCYVTGNGGGSFSNDDIDNGQTTLTSPVFDLSGYNDPWIHYDRWFFNVSTISSLPNDTLTIQLSDGITTKTIETVTATTLGMSTWVHRAIQVSNFFTPGSSMRLIIRAEDYSPGHIVEAGFDHFFVVDSNAVGIVENNFTAQLRVSPNPFNTAVQLRYALSNQLSSDASIEVVDATGRLVQQQPITSHEGVVILGEEWEQGIYFIRVMNGEDATTAKVVKVQ
jgi:choice-of-anchor B domain-containing protein